MELDAVPELGAGEGLHGNLIIEGRQLRSLRTLRIAYSGKVKFIHARALLLCDAGPHGSGEPWKVADVAAALGVTSRTIEHLKERFVEEGLDAALVRKARSTPRKVIFDGEFEARLTALACSPAPEGRVCWTVRLLADKVVELRIAPSVSAMTIQRTLKKRIASSPEQPGKRHATPAGCRSIGALPTKTPESN